MKIIIRDLDAVVRRINLITDSPQQAYKMQGVTNDK